MKDPISMTRRRRELLNALDALDHGEASGLSAGMQRNLRCLQALGPIEVPAALRSPDFLESVYQRAMADEEQLGDLLQRALPARPAPEELDFADGDWDGGRLEDTRAGVGERVAALPPSKAPGWLWSRIRSDIRAQIAEERKNRRWPRFVAAAAAVLVLAGGAFLGFQALNPSNTGTSVEPEIVIQEMAEPLGAPFHPVRLVRELAAR